MCEEFSGIVANIPGEGLRHYPGTFTRYHKGLIALNGLKEGAAGSHFVRYEYKAKDGDYLDCELKIDETRIPSWYEDSAQKVLELIEAWHATMIVDKDTPALIGGRYIIKGEVKIGFADHCKIFVGKKASIEIAELGDNVEFGDIHGSVKTGDVTGTGSVKTGDVTGTVTMGYVSGTVTTGFVSGTVTMGYVSGTGSVKTGIIEEGGIVKSKKAK